MQCFDLSVSFYIQRLKMTACSRHLEMHRFYIKNKNKQNKKKKKKKKNMKRVELEI